MTKRIFCLILSIVLLCATLVACRQGPADDTEKQQQELLTPDALPSRRSVGDFKEFFLAGKESRHALRLLFPPEWSFVKGEGGYSILEGQSTVGRVFAGTPTDTDMQSAKSSDYNDIHTEIRIGMLTRDGIKEPYYQCILHFSGDTETEAVSFEIKQSALDSVALKQYSRATITPITGYKSGATLTLDSQNPSGRILLLGNSFLYPNYSNICAILQELLELREKELEVTRGAFGYASISQFATAQTGSFPTIREDIKNGTYSLVLLCGVYSDEDLSQIATMKALCDEGNAKLALLPAHNENSARISNAIKQYKDVPCLNWQAELNALIDYGMERSDLVYDDAHSHSRPLAGYVGAHLIYRSLFGETPPAPSSDSDAITQAELAKLPDGYATEGFRFIEEKNILRLG